MGQILSNMQFQIKKSSTTLGLVIFKLIWGFFLGLTLTMIGQQILGYGQYMFWFVIAIAMAVFMKLVKSLGFTGMFIVVFVCVLVGLLLKLYVQVAPN